MTEMQEAIQAFNRQNISVLVPGEAEYRHAIATANLLFRFSRPECVVQPETPAQVQTIIREAIAGKLKITIKCNGHSYAGHSTAFSGISLDLRRMKNAVLELDSNSVPKTVTMGAGCQWGDVYEKLIIGRHDGYIINGGRCPTVGVSGFILGAGLGPFTRSFGMGADTLAEATIVTANDGIVTVRKTDPPGSWERRLFWALQGAGGGNFGVVVQMKLSVQKLRNLRGMVVAGRYQWFPPSGFTDDVVATMNAFYRTPWPQELTIDTTWICDLRQASNQGGVRFNVSFDGNKVEYDRLITTHIAHPGLQTQLKRRVLAEESSRFLYETLVAQWLEEAERAYPSNKTYELYSSFIFTKASDFEKITAVICERMKFFREKFNGEQVNFLVTWIHAGGKASEFQSTETAYFWRDALFHAYVTVEWVDKWMELDMRLFLASVKKQLRSLSLNEKAAFMNFPDRDFPTKLHEERYFGGNKDELRKVKQRWDPNNVFKWVHGVRRPGDPEEDDTAEEYAERTDKFASEQWAGMF
ncbi:FAD-binding domain-containing protein [Trematosphaeria pertusa]|uniref:FAD-binding domain-containing protein n=1 Tax=Trematosphaeria pertusa TaxID=390896 RepID=A0A6A6IZR4_9PLEO|nr:FAD-binding domain-containing protein [Trematosphaeria pertusa]KAF2255944.1 FAD-binding domain-containing protein [Trematosphaeria pertusa]